jgi:hypothetical protein
VLLHSRETFHASIIGGNMTLANPAVRQFLAHAPLPALAQLAYAQSAIVSFADISTAISWISLACIPLVFLIRRRAIAGPVHIEVEMG